MKFQPNKITKEHVYKAAEIIDSGEFTVSPSTGYDVIINNLPYPPKEILRFAHELATGQYFWKPSGGEPTNRYLKALGFKVVVKSKNTLAPKSIIKRNKAQVNEKNNTQQSFDEGFRKEIVKEVTTRNKKLINLAKEKYGETCHVCEFNFGETYGTHGEGFIEVHHLNPISKGERKTTVQDLRPVCANCHRMLHRGNTLLSISELKETLKRR